MSGILATLALWLLAIAVAFAVYRRERAAATAATASALSWLQQLAAQSAELRHREQSLDFWERVTIDAATTPLPRIPQPRRTPERGHLW